MNLLQQVSGHNACTTMGFQGPKLLTHPQFASKSHSFSSSAVSSGARAFYFYGVALSNPRHTVRIHLHSEASANFGWTRGSNQGVERRESGSGGK